ncbi:MAG: hypothetical protein SGILL_001739 [Bacillariaceae sp.]
MLKSVATALALLCVTSQVAGFAPAPLSSKTSSTSLNLWKEDSVKKAAGSLMAATFLLGNLVSVAPAVAMDDSFDFGSSQVVAARSGGRAGGRAAPRPAARAPPRPSSRSTTNTRVIERTRYVPTPGYGSPGIIMAPPMYNPLPGYGLGLGFNAINQIGNDMRDYRQEGEIRDARSQLEQARMREAELDARLRALENGQQPNQLTQQQLLMLQQQQLMQQQQQQQAAPAASN